MGTESGEHRLSVGGDSPPASEIVTDSEGEGMATRGRIGIGRRAASVACVAGALALGVASAPLWIPGVVLVDAIRMRRRLPLLRLGLFGLWWAALEIVGIALAADLWMVGLSRNQSLHYRLQRWWAAQVWNGIQTIVGIELDVEGVGELRPGGVVVLARHVSLADSVITAVVLTSHAGLRPRMVLKAELEIDPCLGVVGNRVPNVFIDRSAAESTGGLSAIAHLGVGLSDNDAAVIFPEGTRSNGEKRARALEAISDSDPDRALKFAELRHLLPPRRAGTQALLRSAATADVVTIWHVGLDGLDSFSGIIDAIADGPLAFRFVATRWPSEAVPRGDDLDQWLDDRWLEMDEAVDAAQRHLAVV